MLLKIKWKFIQRDKVKKQTNQKTQKTIEAVDWKKIDLEKNVYINKNSTKYKKKNKDMINGTLCWAVTSALHCKTSLP